VRLVVSSDLPQRIKAKPIVTVGGNEEVTGQVKWAFLDERKTLPIAFECGLGRADEKALEVARQRMEAGRG